MCLDGLLGNFVDFVIKFVVLVILNHITIVYPSTCVFSYFLRKQNLYCQFEDWNEQANGIRTQNKINKNNRQLETHKKSN
jgi:hypothetical protein